MNCPKCGKPGCVRLTKFQETADGVQLREYGYNCLSCGDIRTCPDCSQFDFQPHLLWCPSARTSPPASCATVADVLRLKVEDLPEGGT